MVTKLKMKMDDRLSHAWLSLSKRLSSSGSSPRRCPPVTVKEKTEGDALHDQYRQNGGKPEQLG
ncbi:hypothetical protein H257_13386 [Aphanomyces astaci]|uniref:Uncharacterized protein n=1 Tax=Aphanomyces astaci TaxID=112090 RepID=W4FWD0_APHAT|nr:hypothetical protein H257_13386 [Aphanomyces astaci]ETV71246.1 hypothetical protein H257_13386 [Aphanomyces astaci]|eukprot:XP_009839186.1 hypothetical protein H257_13386 [Aphanomyces astaci]